MSCINDHNILVQSMLCLLLLVFEYLKYDYYLKHIYHFPKPHVMLCFGPDYGTYFASVYSLSMNSIISFFNTVRCDIILLTIQTLNRKRICKNVKASTAFFQHTMNNNKKLDYFLRNIWMLNIICCLNQIIHFKSLCKNKPEKSPATLKYQYFVFLTNKKGNVWLDQSNWLDLFIVEPWNYLYFWGELPQTRISHSLKCIRLVMEKKHIFSSMMFMMYQELIPRCVSRTRHYRNDVLQAVTPSISKRGCVFSQIVFSVAVQWHVSLAPMRPAADQNISVIFLIIPI